MNLGRGVEISACIIMICLLWKFVPRNKAREAWVIFLFKQSLTWILGILVVEMHWIEYPIRFFPHAIRTSFSFEYFLYPSICVLFNLYYPVHKRSFHQLKHYVIYCSSITFIELYIEIYTNSIEYIHWAWYWTWLSLFLTFFMCRHFYLWFFKKEKSGLLS